ncbi:CocE/NonD family hydrolase [Agromyces larvae]|uniref:CocE/NonD family hydrolase n=1 Tax=Agromyces larvae TaxID=2929802 RepID=A0ABY4BW37_9MICO|nr:CocE/NonD family hydrolase [Agromyces larvae]UOE43119.1 CocE/NonD family hydrolase [Agromyces larvae]
MRRTRLLPPVPRLQRSRRGPLIIGTALAALPLALGGISAPAAWAADAIALDDGVSAPVYDYADAIRERVYIPVAGVDQDLDGEDDVTRIEIIRPAESDDGLEVPAIIDPSPYYTTLGRGNEGEFISDTDADGLNDSWPLFYDNYFVPRGYAVILAQMDGTAGSTGCPMHGGPGDIQSMKVVIDWLQGRVEGRNAAGDPVAATWHNGKAAMIGKSYDGTLANGVAATGVEGLTTIVPISAISNWYGYSRTGGVAHNTNYPSGLANTVTNLERRSLCAPTRTLLNGIDGDESGDVNPFWAERDYRTSIDDLHASVFLVHGLNDDNVRMSQVGDYWNALAERDIPRKIWLAKVGHVDPFDFRRAEWVDTLHRWFDHWLLDIDNGIMDEPQATVETAPEQYEDVASWPVPGTEPVDVYLGATAPGAAGALRLQAAAEPASLSFTGPAGSITEGNAINTPTGSQAQRLVFLSEPLTADLRVSGTARVELAASLGVTQANLSALLVDYGPSTPTPRTGEGVQNTATTTCWGAESDADDACYLEVARRTSTVDTWRVSRGALDTSNRESLIEGEGTPLVAGQPYAFSWPLEPYDTTFAAGHRIGVVVTTNLSGYNLAGTASATVTVDAAASRVVLPVVGGLGAAAAAGGLGAPAPVSLSFDVADRGVPIEPQSVAFGTAPVVPADPVSTDGWWLFDGWYADAALTTPFDFAAPLVADATAYAKWKPADATAPGKATLSNTSGWAYGLHDGTYEVVANLWWGVPGRELRLYENGVLVSTQALTPTGTSQEARVAFTGKPNGTYVYTAELVNSRGATAASSTTVKVTDAAPAKPVVSHDNWDRDGVFTVTANLWWGTNATSYRFLLDGVEVGSGELTAATPAAQAATVALTGVAPGAHTLVAVFANANGETASAPVKVEVR